MSIIIHPDSREAEYKQVILKLKEGYLTPDNYKSKIMNTKDVPLEVNKWYIIDIGGWTNSGSTSPNWTQDVEDMDLDIIYPITIPKNISMTTMSNFRIDVYYADIETPFSYTDSPRYPRYIHQLHFHEGYGVTNLNYIPIELNENNKFINWINENPLEVKS